MSVRVRTIQQLRPCSSCASRYKESQAATKQGNAVTSLLEVPDLFLHERLGLPGMQLVALCLGLGLCTSKGVGDYVTEGWLSVIPENPGWGSMALMVLAFWACWEATKFPRHCKMITVWDNIRIAVQFIGDQVLAPFYMVLPGELTDVRYQQTRENQELVAHCPSMWRFKQMAFVRNPIAAFMALMFFDLVGYKYKKMIHREVVKAKDGGSLALDWWGVDKPGANGKQKVAFIASTWSGDSLVSCTREICTHFTAQGWQCVVYVKRGSGLIWPNEQTHSEDGSKPKPWCLGGLEDIELAINHVAESCPDALVCGVGTSLGGLQVRKYINSRGKDCRLAAAVVVDAAEDWNKSMDSIDNRLPPISSILKQTAEATFEVCGSTSSAECPPGGVARRMGKMFSFIRDRQAPAYGYQATDEGAGQYLASCNSGSPAACAIPTLELLSFNDFLIDPESISEGQKAYLKSPHVITCVSRNGTHAIRWSGLRGRCWISQVGCEFAESALRRRAAIARKRRAQEEQHAAKKRCI